MALTPAAVQQKLLDIIKKGTEPFRNKLDTRVALLDFSYSALKISDPKLTQQDYDSLLLEIQSSSTFSNSVSVANSISVAKDPSTRTGYVVFITDPKYGTYLLAKDTGKIQRALAGILKSINHPTVLTQVKDGVIQTNIAHIASPLLDATVTPLAAMITELIKRVPIATGNVLMQQMFKLQLAHNFENSYQFQRDGFDLNSFNKVLGKATILLTAQSFTVNNKLATSVEKTVSYELNKFISSPEFVEHLLVTRGSKTIQQEIYESLMAVITGKPYKSPHTRKKPTVSKDSIQDKGTLGTYKPPKVPSIRNTSGHFYSLASLQQLINSSLQDVISANMGNGGSKSILNYRTGRFAASAKVERLSQSKDGMISAFYSYMKAPYQTFEPGYAQGSPKTRDPKLLIAKSIRDIAATKISNRMRAVLI